MDVTARLLRVYQVDRQLAALESRLKAAERFLHDQDRGLSATQSRREALQSQVRQARAMAANVEGEAEQIKAREATLREQMNSARTNKDYKTLLTEVNALKAQREKKEEEAIALLATVDELSGQIAELDKQAGERSKVRDVAASERAERAAEIRDRVAQLRTEREKAVAEVPAEVLAVYIELREQADDDAMAPLEVADRKRHEYTCAACMMAIPMEQAISLLSGKLTRCPSCTCILYLTAETTDLITPASSKR